MPYRQVDINPVTITNIYAFAFTDIRMRSLWMNYGQLGSIDAEAFHRTPADNSSLQNGMITLDFTGNELTRLHAGVFDCLLSLKWLILGKNKLTSIETALIHRLHNLEGLYIYSNDIRSLPDYLLKDTSVRILYLYDNNLTELSSNVFKMAAVLEILHLGQNALYSFDEDSLQDSPNLRNLVVELDTCDCGILWLKEIHANLSHRKDHSTCKSIELSCIFGLDPCNNRTKEMMNICSEEKTWPIDKGRYNT